VRPAEEHLRWLFRERKLNSAELRRELRALRAFKAGKLKAALLRQKYVARKRQPHPLQKPRMQRVGLPQAVFETKDRLPALRCQNRQLLVDLNHGA